MSALAFACRMILAGSWGVAAVTKLRDGSAGRRLIAGVVPSASPAVVRWIARLAIAGEIVATLLLLIDPLAVAGLVWSLALLGALTAVLVRALRAGIDLSCGCFGRSTRRVSPAHVWRNLALVVVASGGIAATSLATAPPTVPERAIVLLASGVIVALIAFFDDLLTVFDPTGPSVAGVARRPK